MSDGLPAISGSEDLRSALAILLEGKCDTLLVTDPDGQILGTIDLDAIRDAVSARETGLVPSSGEAW